MRKLNPVREHPKKSGRQGARIRIEKAREAISRFPAVFLDLLNARHIVTGKLKTFTLDLAFTHRTATESRLKSTAAGSTKSESAEERLVRTMGFVVTTPAAPQTSLLRRSGPPDYHHFSDEEIEEQEVLRDTIHKGLRPPTWWAIQPAKGTRHLCVLPVLVCNLRGLADRIIGGDPIDDDVAEIWGEFQRRIRNILRDHKDKSAGADDVFTLSNCQIAQTILKAFTAIPTASLALLYRCENPECQRYDLRWRADKKHCSKRCQDHHRYLDQKS
jgi:hypothetical protein